MDLLKGIFFKFKMQNPNEQLIPFLRNLADSIEQKTILPNQLQSIGEFFMKYTFEEEVRKDNLSTSENDIFEDEFEREDLIKFLTLGWFIYCIILKGKTIPEEINISDELNNSEEINNSEIS